MGKKEREDDDNEVATVKAGGKNKQHTTLPFPVSQKQHHREGPDATTETLLTPSLAGPTSDRQLDQRRHVSPDDDEDEAGRFVQAVDHGKVTEDNNKSRQVASAEKDKTHLHFHKDRKHDQAALPMPGAWAWNNDGINDDSTDDDDNKGKANDLTYHNSDDENGHAITPASRDQRGKRKQEDFDGEAEAYRVAKGSKRPRIDNSESTDEKIATPLAPMSKFGKLSVWMSKVARLFET